MQPFPQQFSDGNRGVQITAIERESVLRVKEVWDKEVYEESWCSMTPENVRGQESKFVIVGGDANPAGKTIRVVENHYFEGGQPVLGKVTDSIGPVLFLSGWMLIYSLNKNTGGPAEIWVHQPSGDTGEVFEVNKEIGSV